MRQDFLYLLWIYRLSEFLVVTVTWFLDVGCSKFRFCQIRAFSNLKNHSGEDLNLKIIQERFLDDFEVTESFYSKIGVYHNQKSKNQALTYPDVLFRNTEPGRLASFLINQFQSLLLLHSSISQPKHCPKSFFVIQLWRLDKLVHSSSCIQWRQRSCLYKLLRVD
jgi:hypothetical protein